MKKRLCFSFKKNFAGLMAGMVFLCFFVVLAQTQTCQAGPYSGPLYPNPLWVFSFTDLIGGFLANLQGIVGWLAVIMIVIGGVIYITSGGISTQMALAKTIIVFALVGFAIAVAAPSLLREIRDLAVGFGGGGGPSAIATATPVAVIIANVMNFMLTIVGMSAVIGFAVSGVMYITSGGDTNSAETAKKMMLYSAIAVATTGAGVIVIKQVLQLLGPPVV